MGAAYKVTAEMPKIVIHKCSSCKTTLENYLTQAGSKDSCPKCQKEFVVPGEAERAVEEEKNRVALEDQGRKQAEARILEANELREQERKRRVQQQQKEIQQSAESSSKPINSLNGIQEIPNYVGLKVISSLFSFLGWGGIILSIVGGAVIIVLGDEQARGIAGIGVVLAGISYGIILIAIANAVAALRDIARNSFNTSNTLCRLLSR